MMMILPRYNEGNNILAMSIIEGSERNFLSIADIMVRFAFVLVGRVALVASAIILANVRRPKVQTADHKCLPMPRRPHRHLPLRSFVSSSSSSEVEAEAVILARVTVTSPARLLLPPLIRLFVHVAR